jgi:UDP-glucose 4-epimerase
MANLPSRMTHAAIQGVPVSYGGGPRGGGMPFEEDGGDLCYVKDCALGIQLLVTTEQLNHRVYNLASGVTVTNRQLADAVRQAVPGAHLELRSGPGPGWRPHNYLDITRLTADTGYRPQYTVETAIADYVHWLRSGHEE